MRHVVLAVLAGALAGCLAPPNYIVPDGTSAQQANQDLLECELIAAQAVPVRRTNIRAIMKQREVLNTCMRASGYTTGSE